LSQSEKPCSATGPVLIVSPGRVHSLRGGLYGELGFAGEELGEFSLRRRPQGRAPYREPLGHIDAVRALLEQIGWDEVELPPRVQIDLWVHGALALTVLSRVLDAELDGLADVPPARRRTAEQHIRELREFMADIRRLSADWQSSSFPPNGRERTKAAGDCAAGRIVAVDLNGEASA
jgi:hypothetical protein